MNSRRKSLIPIRIAVILLCAVLVSAHYATGLLAKYTVDSAGADTARSAGLSVEVKDLQGSDGNYTFNVKNLSEVALEYDVIVTFSNPDTGLDVKKVFGNNSVKLDGIDFTRKSTDGRTFTFTSFGQLAANTTATDLNLTFNITGPIVQEDSAVTDPVLTYADFPFTVSVRATQID